MYFFFLKKVLFLFLLEHFRWKVLCLFSVILCVGYVYMSKTSFVLAAFVHMLGFLNINTSTHPPKKQPTKKTKQEEKEEETNEEKYLGCFK